MLFVVVFKLSGVFLSFYSRFGLRNSPLGQRTWILSKTKTKTSTSKMLGISTLGIKGGGFPCCTYDKSKAT